MSTEDKLVAIVPFHRYIEPMIMDSLRGLAAKGYTVREAGNVSDIARQRGMLASWAIAAGYSWILWIDSDVLFEPDDVPRLLAHGKEIVGGVCALRSDKRFNCIFHSQQSEVTFGEGGGLLEVESVGTGFLLTHCTVYKKMAEVGLVTTCVGDEGYPVYPFFEHRCSKIGIRKDLLYLGEDYSFCLRAKEAGFQVYVDTSIRLGHLGLYPYSWEDVISPIERFATCVAKVRQT